MSEAKDVHLMSDKTGLGSESGDSRFWDTRRQPLRDPVVLPVGDKGAIRSPQGLERALAMEGWGLLSLLIL